MKMGLITGSVNATIKHPVYAGHRLLLMKPTDPRGRPLGSAIIGLDTVQAGPGDRVLYMDEGNSARIILGDKTAPVRVVIMAIIDRVDIYPDFQSAGDE